MANMLCRTKENANPRGKPRVYFTCYPADFDRCFDKICEDIFKTSDCAIYYAEDMFVLVQDQEFETDLGSNNLFVIPVTENLLTRPNRAMDVELPYAQRKHIPVLPIMMEPDLDDLYKKSYKFGETQYLNPYSADKTEVPYAEKLKNYLESVLTSAQMVTRIREAFDTYIFLSYRKKDRRYANELMRMIHKEPECRDIAIWYDEFLTPGESFQDSIQKILHDSKLFVLLVTPNLLEEQDGKPNFVMGQEYPAARKAGISILPVEMVNTDQAVLREKYPGIPECIDIREETAFRERLLAAVRKISKPDNNDDPEHMFLIGLAYLEGIDVEVDREHGLRLVTAAAEAGHTEAMIKLHEMYTASDSSLSERKEAGKWALRLAMYYSEEYGGTHELVLHWMQQLVKDRLAVESQRSQAVTLAEHIWLAKRKLCGEDHPDTISALSQLAFAYACDNRLGMAAIIQKHILRLCESRYGDQAPETIQAMLDLAERYGSFSAWQRPVDEKEINFNRIGLYTRVFDLRRETLGEDHEDTLKAMAALAACYGDLQGCEKKSKELYEELHYLRKKNLGEKHPDTLAVLEKRALLCEKISVNSNMPEAMAEAYVLHCEAEGEEHPSTLRALRLACPEEPEETDPAALMMALAKNYREQLTHDRLCRLYEQAYRIRCRELGMEHPDAIAVLYEWGVNYPYHSINKQRALDILREAFDQREKVLGETHPDTLAALEKYARRFEGLPDYRLALDWFTVLYERQCEAWGPEDERTIDTLEDRARIHYRLYNLKIAKMQYERVYSLCLKVYGEDHFKTRLVASELTAVRENIEMEPLWWRKNVCQHCGGEFVGLFRKKCEDCERPKDY